MTSVLVDLCPRSDRRAPWLRRPYPTASLLRARPPPPLRPPARGPVAESVRNCRNCAPVSASSLNVVNSRAESPLVKAKASKEPPEAHLFGFSETIVIVDSAQYVKYLLFTQYAMPILLKEIHRHWIPV